MEEELRATAASLGFQVAAEEIDEYVVLLERMEKSLQTVSDMPGEFEKMQVRVNHS